MLSLPFCVLALHRRMELSRAAAPRRYDPRSGDPLVATFARAYLMRIGVQARIGGTDFMTTAMYDLFFTSQQWDSQPLLAFMQKYNLDLAAYLDLYSPAVQFIMDVVAKFCPADAFRNALGQYKRFCGRGFILQHVLQAFSPAAISHTLYAFLLSYYSYLVSFPPLYL